MSAVFSLFFFLLADDYDYEGHYNYYESSNTVERVKEEDETCRDNDEQEVLLLILLLLLLPLFTRNLIGSAVAW